MSKCLKLILQRFVVIKLKLLKFKTFDNLFLEFIIYFSLILQNCFNKILYYSKRKSAKKNTTKKIINALIHFSAALLRREEKINIYILNKGKIFFYSIVQNRKLSFSYRISKQIFHAFHTSDFNCRFQNGMFCIFIMHCKNTI